jgi:hypothetical protein
VGLVLLALGSVFGTYWGLVGFVPLLTALVGWCPVSALLGVSTCKDEGSTFRDTSVEHEKTPLRVRHFKGKKDKK